MSRSVFLFGGIVVAMAIAATVLGKLERQPRNAILITVDTLRADHLSAYGYRLSLTPNLDRVAREGVRFTTAYCDIPWTTGSLASTMTGTFGPRHGVQSFTNRLSEDQLTLAEILKSRGYTTAAVVASFALDSAFNLDQGFDSYNDEFDKPVFNIPGGSIAPVDLTPKKGEIDRDKLRLKLRNNAYRDDAAVTEVAKRWLAAHRDTPFFLWVHYFGPHERLSVGKPGKLADQVLADYDPDTRTTDTAIGDLLQAIDADPTVAARTLLVLHSDHGQALREHGIFGHGHDLYEESVRIPLMMRLAAAIPSGTVLNTVARNVDIGPTILALLGLPIPDGLDGRSLLPAIQGIPMPDAPVYMEALHGESLPVEMPPLGEYFGVAEWHGLRLGDWKYLRVQMTAPCVRNPARYEYGLLGINPKIAIGGEKIADSDCAKPVRQDLYRVGTDRDYIQEAFSVDRISREPGEAKSRSELVRRIAGAAGYRTGLDLDAAQKDKLKSLGYLQ